MTSKDSLNHNVKPRKQRALILQGGGALGAYEVGVLKGLYKKLSQQDEENDPKDSNISSEIPLFDIVAGTSIGAMNAAVLVSNVVQSRNSNPNTTQKKSWEVAIDRLERFWKEGVALKEGTTAHDDIPPLEMFPMFEWWRPWTKDFPSWAPWKKEPSHNERNINIKDLAPEEAARRYYSTKEFVFKGNKVFSTKEIRHDDKFLDQDVLAKQLVLNDEPLRVQIETFGEFPIATSFVKGEPRLLITAVDIAEGITVTFDSYKKYDGTRKTVYTRKKSGNKKEEVDGDNGNKTDSKHIVIEYENGITIEHIMASGTLPEFYDPKEIDGRKFWDGGLLSNTPLREFLEAHRDYWVNVENQDEAPDLDVYIVNVHPSKIGIDNIPMYYDEIKEGDRSNDILYGDRTYNDQYAASLVTDYIDFIRRLKDLADNYIKEDVDRDAFEKKFESLEAKQAKSTSYTAGEPRSYRDLMKGRFELVKVERIERKFNAGTSTSFKGGDITLKTIKDLIKEGYNDVTVC
jgi:NTE family protein